MKRFNWLLVVAGVFYTLGRSQEKVNPHSLVQDDFSKRVAAYLEIHKKARAEVLGLKPTTSPSAITHYEHELAHKIREQRRGAAAGTIFTPEISAEFRRLIGLTVQGSTGARVQQSLNHAEPIHVAELRVDAAYPEGLPLQSTPPSILLNLPSLPAEVEYRVIGHDLVLRDVDANLIVDFARNIIP